MISFSMVTIELFLDERLNCSGSLIVVSCTSARLVLNSVLETLSFACFVTMGSFL